MIDLSSRRRVRYAFAGFLAAALSIAAQTSTPTSGPAIPLREEGHHHLIFHNSYVNVFFVEIPAHETTLPHHHDFPYVSVPPGGADSTPIPAGESAITRTSVNGRAAYALGNFSHAVTNSRDVTLRNIAIELVRPQGIARSGCISIVKGEPPQSCLDHTPPGYPIIQSLFQTDGILVQSWDFDPNVAVGPIDQEKDVLVAGLNGVTIRSDTGIDSSKALRGGILWVPAGSNAVFKASADRGGHFIAITFKDSGNAH